MALHHRADAAFHALAWFREHSAAVVADLDRGGVRRGPARGAGHVLVELVLDGAVLGRPDGSATFGPVWSALADGGPEVSGLVEAVHRDRWLDVVEQFTTRLDPWAYGDAGYAADRTAGALSRRPRLALDDREHAVLRDVAAAHHLPLSADAGAVLDAVVAAL